MSHSKNERVRLTISLAKDIAEEVDELVDGIKIRNRSHAIESLIAESLDSISTKQVVILAGGEEAITRVPAIKSVLHLLRRFGFQEVFIAVGYLGQEVRESIGKGEEYQLHIRYIESDLGSGGVLLQLKNTLKRTFLVVNVAEPIGVDLKNLFRFHKEHQPVITAATPSLKEPRGIYVIEPKIFQYIPPGFCMIEDTIFEELIKQGKLISYPVNI